MSVVLPLVLFGAGFLAGRLGRYVLHQLPTDVSVPPLCCEIGVGLLWAVAGFSVAVGGFRSVWLPVPLVLAWFGVLLAATDLTQRRLPNALTFLVFPYLVIALLMADLTLATLSRGFLATGLFLAAHFAVYLVAPNALGAGDVKLSVSTGLVLGAISWPALLIGSLGAAVTTLVLAAVGRWRGAGIPHGPGMLCATWLLASFPALGLAAAP